MGKIVVTGFIGGNGACSTVQGSTVHGQASVDAVTISIIAWQQQLLNSEGLTRSAGSSGTYSTVSVRRGDGTGSVGVFHATIGGNGAAGGKSLAVPKVPTAGSLGRGQHCSITSSRFYCRQLSVV